MIKTDKDALRCDLMETYGIFDYRKLPPKEVAIFSIGLREDSRIKMAINKSKLDSIQTLLVHMLDSMNMLVWLNSSDGAKGANRPKSIYDKLMNHGTDKENLSFESAEDFEKTRNEIIRKIERK